ncbi:hypothetical protein FIBSPDRAFT_898276 [Athelia psychrophila]|uniref:Uncharacterized protein n=1 Tax=Athelia psychrophila TaxID=1759441 RepID=A0A166B5G9_9AGAM|nr:hypothetical protein FIBSPDRAFT_898276 [Fibularhizoctonia sp. CBS 109695]
MGATASSDYTGSNILVRHRGKYYRGPTHRLNDVPEPNKRRWPVARVDISIYGLVTVTRLTFSTSILERAVLVRTLRRSGATAGAFVEKITASWYGTFLCGKTSEKDRSRAPKEMETTDPLGVNSAVQAKAQRRAREHARPRLDVDPELASQATSWQEQPRGPSPAWPLKPAGLQLYRVPPYTTKSLKAWSSVLLYALPARARALLHVALEQPALPERRPYVYVHEVGAGSPAPLLAQLYGPWPHLQLGLHALAPAHGPLALHEVPPVARRQSPLVPGYHVSTQAWQRPMVEATAELEGHPLLGRHALHELRARAALVASVERLHLTVHGKFVACCLHLPNLLHRITPGVALARTVPLLARLHVLVLARHLREPGLRAGDARPLLLPEEAALPHAHAPPYACPPPPQLLAPPSLPRLLLLGVLEQSFQTCVEPLSVEKRVRQLEEEVEHVPVDVENIDSNLTVTSTGLERPEQEEKLQRTDQPTRTATAEGPATHDERGVEVSSNERLKLLGATGVELAARLHEVERGFERALLEPWAAQPPLQVHRASLLREERELPRLLEPPLEPRPHPVATAPVAASRVPVLAARRATASTIARVVAHTSVACQRTLACAARRTRGAAASRGSSTAPSSTAPTCATPYASATDTAPAPTTGATRTCPAARSTARMHPVDALSAVPAVGTRAAPPAATAPPSATETAPSATRSPAADVAPTIAIACCYRSVL